MFYSWPVWSAIWFQRVLAIFWLIGLVSGCLGPFQLVLEGFSAGQVWDFAHFSAGFRYFSFNLVQLVLDFGALRGQLKSAKTSKQSQAGLTFSFLFSYETAMCHL